MKITNSKLYFDIQIPDANLQEEFIDNIAEVQMDVFPEIEIKITVNSTGKYFNNRLFNLRYSEEKFDIEIGNLQLTVYISSYQIGKFDAAEMYHKKVYLSLTPVWEEELELELIPF